MNCLPREIKLTVHARKRMEERKDFDITYNTKNLMRSSCKWYGKDDLIYDSNLYLHCLYMCRKSNQIGYITDGKIEVVYNKNTKYAITIVRVKEKFLPIEQYIKPNVLEKIERKKEDKKLKKLSNTECELSINENDIMQYFSLKSFSNEKLTELVAAKL